MFYLLTMRMLFMSSCLSQCLPSSVLSVDIPHTIVGVVEVQQLYRVSPRPGLGRERFEVIKTQQLNNDTRQTVLGGSGHQLFKLNDN